MKSETKEARVRELIALRQFSLRKGIGDDFLNHLYYLETMVLCFILKEIGSLEGQP